MDEQYLQKLKLVQDWVYRYLTFSIGTLKAYGNPYSLYGNPDSLSGNPTLTAYATVSIRTVVGHIVFRVIR